MNAAQYAVLLKHEQAHIWLNHRTRKPDCAPADVRPDVWRTALEIEIARNIYLANDIAEIKKPMTVISGGFVPDSYPKMPAELMLAEDIYDWLAENPDEQPAGGGKMFCACSDCEGEGEGEGGGEEEAPTQAEIDEIKTVLEEMAKKTAISDVKDDGQSGKRTPSLANEIDYILRKKSVRERTYLRPSRREISGGIILRGRRKRKKSPLVEIFVDRSGSMSGEKTGASEEKLCAILSRYKAKIRNDVFYFSNEKLYDHDVPPRGSNPYGLVMDHLEKSRPKIAVILTDYDTSSTEGLKPLEGGDTTIICVPICATHTAISKLIGAIERT
ncbi:MAG: hypothetical protein KGL39_55440 [Patescibacteria group bacterium]|nr:hypothetical protein [Patescibacteria group bacterium]